MAGADRSRLQNTQYSGQSCLFTLTTAGGNSLANLEGVMGSGYEDKRTRSYVWGSRRDGRPLGLTAGRYEPGALTIDVEEATADFITDALASEAPDGESFGDVGFTMQVQLYEEDKNDGTLTFVFDGCYIISDKGDYPNTTDGLKKSLGFMYMSKTSNGKSLFSQTRSP